MHLLGTLQRNIALTLSLMLLSFLFSAPAFSAKLAIVIDDFGYRKKEDNQILQLPTAVSIAILPNSPHGKEGNKSPCPRTRDSYSYANGTH